MKAVVVITSNDKSSRTMEIREYGTKAEARKALASEFGFRRTRLSNETWVGEVPAIVGYTRAKANVFSEREWLSCFQFCY